MHISKRSVFSILFLACLCGVVIFGLGVCVCALAWLSIHYLHWYTLCLPPGTLLVWLVFFRRSFQNNHTYQLVSEYVRAKKDRFCPTVEFTE